MLRVVGGEARLEPGYGNIASEAIYIVVVMAGEDPANPIIG